jgi:hypothetical protein
MELRHVRCSARVVVDTYDILSLRTRECPMANYVCDPPPHMRSQRNSTYRSISLHGSCRITAVNVLHFLYTLRFMSISHSLIQDILGLIQAFSATFGVHNEIEEGTPAMERSSGIKDPIHLQRNFTWNECAWIELSI